jgi:shikimate kinase
MMGAGKSSVGRCLHRRTGFALYDTDEIVAANFGIPIAQIFSQHGEEEFRAAETEALRRVRTEEQTIIVTGGGVVLRRKNVEILRRKAVIVWLDADEQTLFSRASRNQDRPLLRTQNPRESFSEILGTRRPLYAKAADVRVSTSGLTDEEVAVAILSKLGRVNPEPKSPPTAGA